MLDEHFEEQMNEIIKLCPVKRQTMLFSATMTDKVPQDIHFGNEKCVSDNWLDHVIKVRIMLSSEVMIVM